MNKELFMHEGYSTGADLVDETGRFYRILTRSTIVSDHTFDTSGIPNWIPVKGSRWLPLTLADFEARSMPDGRIVFDS
jgi:hypothetical protein